MARRRIRVADIKEVLVAWAAGTSVSAIARMLGYTRPPVRKYITAGQKLGLRRPAAQRTDWDWEALARAVQERWAAHRESGTVRAEVAHHHVYLQERVGTLPLSVLHQRLRNEQGLRASWGSFYRYCSIPQRRYTK
jgi:predicted transcriptional regulator